MKEPCEYSHIVELKGFRTMYVPSMHEAGSSSTMVSKQLAWLTVHACTWHQIKVSDVVYVSKVCLFVT